VARTFGIDPLVVLDDREMRAHIRLAAYRVTVKDDEEEARRNKK
jgi:hypothetical protein